MSLEEQIKTLKPVLKKIAAGGGQITGSFYFIRNGDTVHLAATLARQDPSGKKVVKSASNLAAKDAGLKGGKFAHGKIYTEPESTGKKLIFHLNALKGVGARGSLKAGKLREGLKLFTKQNPGFSFLTAVIMRDGKEEDGKEEEVTSEVTPEVTDAPSIDDEPSLEEIEADLELSDEELADLEEIKADEKALAAANENLKALLSGLSDEQQADIAGLLADILQLSRGDDAEALAAAREELAKNLGPGKTFPEVGERVPPEIQALMGSANDATLQMLQVELDELEARINTIHDEVRGHGEDGQDALEAIAPDRLAQLLHCEASIERLKAQISDLSQSPVRT
jgi:hypothetical protein